jgi:hypothetical protein
MNSKARAELLALIRNLAADAYRPGEPEPDYWPLVDEWIDFLKYNPDPHPIVLRLDNLDQGRWGLGDGSLVRCSASGLGEAWAAFRAGPLGVPLRGSPRAAWNRRDAAARAMRRHDARLADAVLDCRIERGRLIYRGREPVVTRLGFIFERSVA